MAAGLSLCILLTNCPNLPAAVSVLAAEEEAREQAQSMEITGFEKLPDRVARQTVSVGTKLEELTLPDTLAAYVVAENSGGGVKTPEASEDGEDSEDGKDSEDMEEGDPDAGDGTGEDIEGEGEPDDGDDGEEEGEGEPGDGDDGEEEDEGTPGDGDDGEEEGEGEPGDGDDGEEEGEGESGDGTGEDIEGEGEPGEGGGEDGEGTPGDGDGTDEDTQGDPDAGEKEVGFRKETGSFVMPVYGSEYMQDDLTAGTLTADGQEADTESETNTEEVTIEDIVWEASPAYDGDREGVYLFTPILPKEYDLAEDVSLPEIRVSVGCVHGIVAAGEDCPVCGLQEEIDALPRDKENSFIYNGSRYPARLLCDLLHTEGAKALASYQEDFYAGMPAVTVHAFGKGKAYYVAARSDAEFYNQFLQDVCKDDCGIRPLLMQTRGVEVVLRKNEKGSYLFLLNHNDAFSRVWLEDGCTDMLSGEYIHGGREIKLAPKDVRILKKE